MNEPATQTNGQQPQPPTHIALTLQVRDAMINQLGPLPHVQVEGIINALRTAPQITVNAKPTAKPPANPPSTAASRRDVP